MTENKTRWLSAALFGLSALAALVMFGFWFAGIWTHGHDHASRMSATGFLAAGSRCERGEAMRRSYADARVTCPLTLCGWMASTGKPEGRQEWAKLHLELAEMLVEHLTNDHRVDRIGPLTCTALGKGINGEVLGCTLPREHEGPHQDEGTTWVASEVYP